MTIFKERLRIWKYLLTQLITKETSLMTLKYWGK